MRQKAFLINNKQNSKLHLFCVKNSFKTGNNSTLHLNIKYVYYHYICTIDKVFEY